MYEAFCGGGYCQSCKESSGTGQSVLERQWLVEELKLHSPKACRLACTNAGDTLFCFMRVYINQTICKFLFLHDISGWHYSSRLSFRNYWIRKPFPLTQDERNALELWRELNAKFYMQKGDFILVEFLSGKLNKKYRKLILRIFKVFEPRFRYNYLSQGPNMKKIARYLQTFKNLDLARETFRLYGLKVRIMPVYIAMSYDANKSAGGMQLGNRVILQFGDYKLRKDNSPLLNILFHELTHKGSVKRYLPRNLKIKLPRSFTGDKKDFVDEVVHQALWSEIGLFSQEQFCWTNKEISKKKKFLLKHLSSPYKEMLRVAFEIRKYLFNQLNQNPEFRFTRVSVKKILSVMER